jgi:Ohr subfamily peroxiredoxin
MTKTLYTTEAHVTGGRAEGHGRTSDGALEVDLRIPTEMGGPGGGTNPEQLFAVGYAACFESALGVVARRLKANTGDVAIDSKVSLSPDGKGGFLLGVQLDVTLPSVTDSATEVCPYSNATRNNIEVVLTANGLAID